MGRALTKKPLPETDVEWLFAPLTTVMLVVWLVAPFFDRDWWVQFPGWMFALYWMGLGLMIVMVPFWWWMLISLYRHPERWSSTGGGGRI